jgi:nitrous oxidase accessory protein NosD
VDLRKPVLSLGVVALLTLVTPVAAFADSGGGGYGHNDSGHDHGGSSQPAKPKGKVVKVKEGESIQAALNAAKPGTTIKVARGIYREQLVVTKSGITLDASHAQLLAPDTFETNVCTGVTRFGPPNPFGQNPDANVGICVVGDMTFGEFNHFEGAKTGNTIRTTLTGVSVSGFTVSGFGTGILVAGAEGTKVEYNRVDGTDPYGILALDSPNTFEHENTVWHAEGEPGGPPNAAGVGVCAVQSPGMVWLENDISGFVFGICVASDHARVERNNVHDNHVGISVDRGRGHAVIVGNNVHHNTRVERAFGEALPIVGGFGILIDGGHDVTILGNDVTDNYTAPLGSPGNGGIVVADAAAVPPEEWPGGIAGAVAYNVRVEGNTAQGNVGPTPSADLVMAASGTGNVAIGNDCSVGISGFPEPMPDPLLCTN